MIGTQSRSVRSLLLASAALRAGSVVSEAGPLRRRKRGVSSEHQAFLHDLLGVFRIRILRISFGDVFDGGCSSVIDLFGREIVFGGEGAAFDHGIGDLAGEEADGAQRVVVAGDHPIDFVGIAVGIDDGDHRNTKAAGFFHRDGFLVGIDDEDTSGRPGMSLMPARF